MNSITGFQEVGDECVYPLMTSFCLCTCNASTRFQELEWAGSSSENPRLGLKSWKATASKKRLLRESQVSNIRGESSALCFDATFLLRTLDLA